MLKPIERICPTCLKTKINSVMNYIGPYKYVDVDGHTEYGSLYRCDICYSTRKHKQEIVVW